MTQERDHMQNEDETQAPQPDLADTKLPSGETILAANHASTGGAHEHGDKGALWESENQQAKKIKDEGMQAVADSPEAAGAVNAAMAKKPDTVTCIDERAIAGAQDEGARGCIGCAGCGILIDGSVEFFNTGTVSKALQEYFDYLKSQKIRSVMWHPGCGAAQNFAGRIGREDVDAVAEEWAQKVADAIGAESNGTSITPESMHNARAVYYDATTDGRFDATVSDVFLTGFHISEVAMGRSQAVSEAGVAIGIAFNNKEHGGFGDLFTAENPLFIIIVAHSDAEASAIRGALRAVTGAHGGRVVIDTLIVKKP